MGRSKMRIGKNKVAPAPTTSKVAKPSIVGNVANNIATGMSFGIGSGLGHAAVNSVLGSTSNKVDIQPQKTEDKQISITCQMILNEYKECLKNKESSNFDIDCSSFIKKSFENGC